MVILDTDILIGLLRGNEEAIEKTKDIKNKGSEAFITAITAYELYKGAYLSHNPEKTMLQVNELLNNVDILFFDLEASRISAKIFSELKKKGTITNLMDQMIASIAISKDKTLITRNTKHYKHISELKMEIW